jgi:hypothetical protein
MSTIWIDSNDPHVTEGIMLVGDESVDPPGYIHPIFYALGWAPPGPYVRGVYPNAAFYTRWTTEPERHPDYDDDQSPNYHRAIVGCEDWQAELCFDREIEVTIGEVTRTVTLPSSGTVGKPSDWPVPPEWP